MSFGFSLDDGRLEYAGKNFNSFFAQHKNLLSIKHLEVYVYFSF